MAPAIPFFDKQSQPTTSICYFPLKGRTGAASNGLSALRNSLDAPFSCKRI
jgi:hypothetical protein